MHVVVARKFWLERGNPVVQRARTHQPVEIDDAVELPLRPNPRVHVLPNSIVRGGPLRTVGSRQGKTCCTGPSSHESPAATIVRTSRLRAARYGGQDPVQTAAKSSRSPPREPPTKACLSSAIPSENRTSSNPLSGV